MSVKPVLVIHGGACDERIDSRRVTVLTPSLARILSIVNPKLQKGMSALEAVSLACSLLEDDPLYNAGKGSKIQSDGKIRMSASLMDGSKRRFAGCVNVEGVKNPIFLAKALLKEDDRVLSGKGAAQFARDCGLQFASPYTMHQRAAWLKQKQGKSGTIGAIALDSRGRLCAGTSTGGRGHEYPFRVSDSPTTAGNFASDNCAVSATGTGEEIVEQSAASTICAYMDLDLTLDAAVTKVLIRARKARANFGLIALDHKGRFQASVTRGSIVWAAATSRSTHILKM